MYRTVWGRGNRRSIPGKENANNVKTKETSSLAKYAPVACGVDGAHIAVLAVIRLVSLLTRALVTAGGAVLEDKRDFYCNH